MADVKYRYTVWELRKTRDDQPEMWVAIETGRDQTFQEIQARAAQIIPGRQKIESARQ